MSQSWFMRIKGARLPIVRLTLATGSLLLTANVCAHAGPLNDAALLVCQQKQRSQACQYEGGHNDLFIGTCQYVSEEDLICVRNRPIQKADPDKEEAERAHEG